MNADELTKMLDGLPSMDVTLEDAEVAAAEFWIEILNIMRRAGKQPPSEQALEVLKTCTTRAFVTGAGWMRHETSKRSDKLLTAVEAAIVLAEHDGVTN